MEDFRQMLSERLRPDLVDEFTGLTDEKLESFQELLSEYFSGVWVGEQGWLATLEHHLIDVGVSKELAYHLADISRYCDPAKRTGLLDV